MAPHRIEYDNDDNNNKLVWEKEDVTSDKNGFTVLGRVTVASVAKVARVAHGGASCEGG